MGDEGWASGVDGAVRVADDVSVERLVVAAHVAIVGLRADIEVARGGRLLRSAFAERVDATDDLATLRALHGEIRALQAELARAEGSATASGAPVFGDFWREEALAVEARRDAMLAIAPVAAVVVPVVTFVVGALAVLHLVA